MNNYKKNNFCDQIIPDHVFKTYKHKFNLELYPNIVRTRNITKEGLDLLISKNILLWSQSIYTDTYNYIEGIITWGKENVIVYFKRVDNDNSFNIFILNDKQESINLLLKGLNKYFTIDQI